MHRGEDERDNTEFNPLYENLVEKKGTLAEIRFRVEVEKVFTRGEGEGSENEGKRG